MDGKATGVLDVALHGEVKRYEWNGNVEDRDAARLVFETLVTAGGVLATVKDAPQKSHQVRTFGEVEETERERGLVEVTITPAIVGG